MMESWAKPVKESKHNSRDEIIFGMYLFVSSSSFHAGFGLHGMKTVKHKLTRLM